MLKSKFLKFSAFSLAAIALAFNFAACDSGNDEYLEETPTNTYADRGASIVGSEVTALWNNFNAEDSLPDTEGAVQKGTVISPDSGKKATLTVVTLSAKYNSNKLQTGCSKTSTLEKIADTKGILKLTVEGNTNITLKGCQSGSSDLKNRFLAIASDEKGSNLIVSKDFLNKEDSTLHIKNAPKGDYYIFANGAKISEINASATNNTVEKPVAYTSSDDWVIEYNSSKGELSLYSDTAKKNNVTGSAVWKIMSGDAKLEGSKLTITEGYTGSVVVRARIGRFYKDYPIDAN